MLINLLLSWKQKPTKEIINDRRWLRDKQNVITVNEKKKNGFQFSNGATIFWIFGFYLVEWISRREASRRWCHVTQTLWWRRRRKEGERGHSSNVATVDIIIFHFTLFHFKYIWLIFFLFLSLCFRTRRTRTRRTRRMTRWRRWRWIYWNDWNETIKETAFCNGSNDQCVQWEKRLVIEDVHIDIIDDLLF